MDKILAELASTCCCEDKDGKKRPNDIILLIIIIAVIALCSCGGARPNFMPGCNSGCAPGNQSGASWIWLIIIFAFLFSGFGTNGRRGNVNTNLINVDRDDGYDDDYYD